ncbi:hypothetical protein ACHQM5_003013 [Ranunculus cassubicifolius]
MQSNKIPQSPTLAGHPTPIPGYRNQKNSLLRANSLAAKFRSTTLSTSPSSHRMSQREMVVSGRLRCVSKELLKRALAPPVHRSITTFRWWNFTPSPSRLSRMSTTTEETK